MPADVKIPLQEFDSAVPRNFSAQLLCEPEHVGKKKIRISAAFLEARGFRTTICERPFDETTKRQGEEPFVALAGFDAAPPRRCLESGGFDLVIDCALGEDSAWFDRILLHTFPNAKRKAADIWEVAEGSAVPKELVEKLHNEEDCGILAATLAGKAVSTAFVGAFAGAMVTGELLRALHGGMRCEFIHAQLRLQETFRLIPNTANYQNMVARSGFTQAEEL